MNLDDIIHPRWKRRYTIAVTVVTAIIGALAFFANSKQAILFVEDALPFSVARFIPGSAAERFNTGSFLALTNRSITDERILYYLGVPTAARVLPDNIHASSYENSFGNVYLERRSGETTTVVVASQNEPLPPSVRKHLSANEYDLAPTLAALRENGRMTSAVFAFISPSTTHILVRKGLGEFVAGYRFSAFLKCDGSDSVSRLLGYNISEDLSNCETENSALKGAAYFAASLFQDAQADSNKLYALMARSADIIPRLRP